MRTNHETRKQAVKPAPCTLKTHVDPEDGFERTAIVMDKAASFDLVDGKGHRICQINAFCYKPSEENKNLAAIVDVILREGDVGFREEDAVLLFAAGRRKGLKSTTKHRLASVSIVRKTP